MESKHYRGFPSELCLRIMARLYYGLPVFSATMTRGEVSAINTSITVARKHGVVDSNQLQLTELGVQVLTINARRAQTRNPA